MTKLKRRTFLKSAIGFSTMLALSQKAAIVHAAQNRLFVTAETTAGKLRGVIVDGIHQFRGVPYGASTDGKNRFRPPQDVPAWTGVRDTYGYGEVTPQPYSSPRHPFGDLIDFDLHVGAMGEDCLNLNIWTPGLRDGKKRPVLVYFHGGGLSTGTANHDLYIGDRLARYGDVVVITVNHRLNAFGYLNLADLGAPDEFGDAGNAGILDLVKSLEWVRDNVENFGGDPGNVMIFGQSGGGTKVGTLMAMPAARGLFHRAAIQSGSLYAATKQDSAKAAERLLRALGIGKGDWRKLQTVSAEEILEAQIAVGSFDWIFADAPARDEPAPQFLPVVGSRTLPYGLMSDEAIANSADVPLVIGYCFADAGWTETNFNMDDEGLLESAARLVGEDMSAHVLMEYKRAYPNLTPFVIQGAMMTDSTLLQRVNEVAERRARASAAAWVYRFDWPSKAAGGRFGATHGMDMSLVFHNTHQPTLGGDTPEARQMADRMAAAWIAFARAGDPNNELMPAWLPYSEAGHETMVINSPHQRLVNDPNAPFLTLWQNVSKD